MTVYVLVSRRYHEEDDCLYDDNMGVFTTRQAAEDDLRDMGQKLRQIVQWHPAREEWSIGTVEYRVEQFSLRGPVQ